jgi:hypothetical protein
MGDLVTARDRLAAAGCLESESDHGATKAVYGHDPYNNTVELTWVLPSSFHDVQIAHTPSGSMVA